MKKTKFKQTEIGIIPEEWRFEELEKHAKIIMGQSPESKYYNLNKDGTVFLQGIRTFGSYYPNYDTWTTRITKLAKKDSVLLSVRAPVGEVNITDRAVCIGRGLMSIDGKNNKFIFYLFKNFKAYVTNKETGTVYGSVTRDDMAKIKFPFPELSEQSAIAKILSDLDSKIELNQQMNKTLESIGQAIFKRWFIDFEFPNEKGKPYKSSGGEMVDSELGEIPKGWKVSKIGKEIETILGGTPSTTNKSYWENGTVAWINSGEINSFPIINASQYITELGLNNSATQLMPKKTVVLPFVISINKEIKISITGIETTGNQSVLGIIENQKIPCEFIYYWVEKMKEDIYSWATGGAQQHINKKNVDNTIILIPNNNIMNNFKKLLTPIFDKILNNSYQTKNLSQIRDSLLPRLMSGKIRVPVEVHE